MTFTIVQDDTAPPINSQLTDGGKPIDLSSVSNIHFHMEDNFHRPVLSDDLTGRVNIVDKTLAIVEYAFTNGDTSDIGKYYGEWEILYDDGKIETFPSNDKIEIHVTEQIK